MQLPTQLSAFLYPGQGIVSRDICAYYSFLNNLNRGKTEEYLEVMQLAMDEINPEAKFQITKALSDETVPSFQKTSFTQPVTYMLSILTYDLIHEKTNCGFIPEYMLGHSLGAFSALTAAGSLPFNQGAKVVVARSKYMQEACETSETGLFAILGLTEEKVLEICDKTGVVIALINAPTAFVVGGQKDTFSQVEQESTRLGARKAFQLETAGAFHTKAMKSAYERFRKFFSTYSLQIPDVPVVTNIYGKGSQNPDELKNDVIESIIKPVNWAKMISFLQTTSVTVYVEVGPGTSMTSLSRLNGIQREQTHHASSLLA